MNFDETELAEGIVDGNFEETMQQRLGLVVALLLSGLMVLELMVFELAVFGLTKLIFFLF